MNRAVLTLHFRDEETLRNLERAAEALGVSRDELAEAAIERELAAIGAGLEGRLTKTSGPVKRDRDIRRFARSEAELKDPLQARREESPDTAEVEEGTSAVGPHEGQAIPSWFGALGKTARTVTRHEMSAIRESIARGIARDRDL